MKSNTFLTIILSLLFPGLGHIYNNKFTKGMIISFIQLLLLLLLIGTLGILGIPAILLTVYSVYDAYKITKNNHEKIKVSSGYVFKFFLAVLIIFSYVYLIISTILAYNSPPLKESEAIIEIQNYLHDKYQQDFIVTEIEYIPAIKEYIMSTYPLKDPNLKFNVSKYSYSEKIDENYLTEKWSKEAEVILDTVINQFFPNNFSFRINVRIKGNYMELIPYDIQYQDLRKSNAKELTHTIFIHTIQNSDTFNKSIESQRINKFIKYLKENNIHGVALDIQYYKPSLNQLLSKEGEIDPYSNKLDEYRLKGFVMSRKDYETVKEPKDIEDVLNF